MKNKSAKNRHLSKWNFQTWKVDEANPKMAPTPLLLLTGSTHHVPLSIWTPTMLTMSWNQNRRAQRRPSSFSIALPVHLLSTISFGHQDNSMSKASLGKWRQQCDSYKSLHMPWWCDVAQRFYRRCASLLPLEHWIRGNTVSLVYLSFESRCFIDQQNSLYLFRFLWCRVWPE